MAVTGRDERRGAPAEGPRARLDALVARAGAVLVWEAAWPVLWRGLIVLCLFLAASWLGLWLDLSASARMVGVGLFALAGLAVLAPLARLRPPGRGAALARIDRDAAGRGLAHGPARALDDTLALGGGDPGARLLWDLHQRRAAAAVAGLAVAAPRPAMARRDPFALRAGALLAAAASAFVAGPEIGERLGAAFAWGERPEPAPSLRVDGWIDPPLYTRLPPLIVALGPGVAEQRLRAPVRSTLVVRVAGRGGEGVTIVPGRGLAPVAKEAEAPRQAGASAGRAEAPARVDLREERYTLTGGTAEVTLRTGALGSGQRLVVEAIPDRPPEIAIAAPPEVNARGTFNLAYRAKDDYGVAGAEAVFAEPVGGGRRTLAPAPQAGLTLPADATGEAETRATLDLTNHPWAGARVKLTLLARDEAGQEGRSETIDFTLPQRPFTKPLARALVEERRRLVLDPDGARRRVQIALDALLIAPDQFTPQWGVYLGLRSVAARLRGAKTDADLVEVADFLWTMALQIEDGDLSGAERDLRAAQERLREALERNAPPDEVRRLTDELRQAMDKFLREFAERMQREQQDAQGERPASPNDRVISRNDLEQMLNQMQEAMRRGDVAEAQRLLEQLRNTLENLQAARPSGRMSDPMAREMNRSMEELEAMAREQQGLRDETFRQGQERRSGRDRRGQPGQQGQQGQGQQGQRGQGQQGQRGQGQRGQQGQGQQGQGQQGQGQQPGEEGGEGGGEGSGGVGERQRALRERLQQLQRRMAELGMQGEQGLADAEGAMREAEGALGQGQEGSAVDAQGRALEGLQRGTQGMAQQMQQMMGQGEGGDDQGDGMGQQPGPGNPEARGRANARDSDPLGRPTRGRDFSDGRVRVPGADESAVERARRIMEELRRKLGDPTRPQQELDYFERLLRR